MMNDLPSASLPKISVLLPAFNAVETIRETVSSVLTQTESDFEFLIVDDGSTDGTAEAVAQMVMGDERVKLMVQENAGMAVTLNRLIDQSRGRYLARIDADDLAEPTRFAKQFEFMESNPNCVLVGSSVLNIDGDGDPYGVTTFPADHEAIESRLLSGSGGIMHPSVMMRRSVVQKVGGFALDLPVAEDQDLWLRMARMGHLANLQEPLTRYRVHPQNMSFVRQAEGRDALHRLLEKAHAVRGLEFIQRDNAEVELEPVSAWDRERTWAWTAVQENHYATARKHARRLVLQKPLSSAAWKLLIASYCPRLFEMVTSRRGGKRSA